MFLFNETGFRKMFPDLPSKALAFFHFSDAPRGPKGVSGKTLLDFCQSVAIPNPDGNSSRMPGQVLVELILEKLSDLGFLMRMGGGNTLGGLDNRYLCTRPKDEIAKLKDFLNFVVYGFNAIYDDLKDAVLPVIHTDKNGEESLGSSFLIDHNTILTAAHCLVGAKSLSIKGVLPEQFSHSNIFISKNDSLDLAVIRFPEPILETVLPIGLGAGEVMDEVLAMGYPNVPGFTEMLSVEKAAISSRFTVTKGIIASKAHEIFAKTSLLLITARVKGGFSGGPVINNKGWAVGLVSRQPISGEKDDSMLWEKYDNLGYGVVIPTEEILHFFDCCRKNDYSVVSELDRDKITYNFY